MWSYNGNFCQEPCGVHAVQNHDDSTVVWRNNYLNILAKCIA